jgi:hypothetical protein
MEVCANSKSSENFESRVERVSFLWSQFSEGTVGFFRALRIIVQLR